mgnify:CR=1 FL=1|jgi:phosphatidylglycerophosphatase A
MTKQNKKYSNYDPVILLASCLGAGLLPRAPGTYGSIFGMVLYFITLALGREIQIVLSVVFLLIGIQICEKAAKKLDQHDHPSIVWDEMAVMYGILLFVPITIMSWVSIFLLFRLFDIWKPWPINSFDQRVRGGLGIMGDDVLAGFAALLLQKILFLLI